MRLGSSAVFGPVVAVLLAAAFRFELWLVAMGTVAMIVVVGRRYVHEQQRWLPALLAVRAVAPARSTRSRDDLTPPAAELVVLSKGQLTVLDRAARLEQHEEDVRTWASTVGRLTVAHELLGNGDVPGVVPVSGTPMRRVLTWSMAAAVALGATVLTSSGWWLTALVVAYSGAMIVWTDWRDERHWRPSIVAHAARSGATTTYEEGWSVAAQLAVLARGRRRPLDRALGMVDRWHGPDADRATAERRLAAATVLLEDSGIARATLVGAVVTSSVTVAAGAVVWTV